jgi:predicted amino acid-binding ACT domain protein
MAGVPGGVRRVAVDGAGDLFYSVVSAGTGAGIGAAAGAVYMIGAGSLGSGAPESIGTFGYFSSPFGVSADAGGNVYVVDSTNAVVQQVSIGSSVATVVAGSRGIVGYVNGPGTFAKFNYPVDVAADSGAGQLYVSDYNNHVIRVVGISASAASSRVVSTVAGSISYGYGYSDGVGTNARFMFPSGLALFAPTRSLFIAEIGSNAVRRLDTTTRMVTTFAGAGMAASSGFRDGTGIIRSVGTAFANAGISIQSILQNPIKDKNDAMFVVMTDPADVSQVKAACVELEAQDWCLGNTFYMPVL